MRLKEVLENLNENKSPKEQAEKFLKFVRSGNWIIPQRQGINLWRGTEREVTVGVKEAYTDVRTPMNTSSHIQKILDEFTRRYKSEWPLRSLSRFASTELSFVQSYGTPHYVFPKKGSKIVSFDRDAFINYFGKRNEKPSYFVEQMRNFLSKSGKDWEYVEEKFGEEITNFIMAYYLAMDAGDYNLFKKLADKYNVSKHYSVFKKAHELMGDAEEFYGSGDFYSAVLTGEKMLENMISYFNDGEKGIEPNSEEVIVQGDILHARKTFVDDWLEFDQDENQWKLDIFG